MKKILIQHTSLKNWVKFKSEGEKALKNKKDYQ